MLTQSETIVAVDPLRKLRDQHGPNCLSGWSEVVQAGPYSGRVDQRATCTPPVACERGVTDQRVVNPTNFVLSLIGGSSDFGYP